MTCTSRTSYNVLPTYISTYLRMCTYIVISKCPSSSSPLKDRVFLNRVPFSILFTRWKASLKYERTCWEIGNLFLKKFSFIKNVTFFLWAVRSWPPRALQFFQYVQLVCKKSVNTRHQQQQKLYRQMFLKNAMKKNYLKWPRDW